MNSGLPGSKHPSGQRLCLGCLTGGGHGNNPSYKYYGEFTVNTGGTIEYAVHARGNQRQTCQVPAEGGKVIVDINSTDGGSICVEHEKITRETKIKKGETVIQEIDQEQLENEVEKKELETLEQENEDEMNRELEGKDRELKREPEKEPEREQEIEKE